MRLGTYYRYLVLNNLKINLAGTKVLDIGCFDGFLLSQITANEKNGIDLMIDERYPGINYIVGDFITYDFKMEKFDKVFALDVMEHVIEDKLFLDKIVNILSHGGSAILSIPCVDIKIFPYFLHAWIDKKWGHIYRRGYSHQSITNLAEDNKAIVSNYIEWNCPIFRSSYLVLSILWKISPFIAKKILHATVKADSYMRSGNNGFIFFEIRG